jgi:hypothetical protein
MKACFLEEITLTASGPRQLRTSLIGSTTSEDGQLDTFWAHLEIYIEGLFWADQTI